MQILKGRPLFTPQKPLKEKIDIVGMSGSGKNVLAEYLLKLDPNPYVVFDTLGVFSTPLVRRGGQPFRPRFPQTQRIITPLDVLGGFFTQKPKKDSIDPLQTLFDATCKQVVAEGNLTFWVDESAAFSDKWWYVSKLKDIANKGQNINLNLAIIHQRPAQLHNDILANCHHRFIFALELDRDRDFYARTMPDGKAIMLKHQRMRQHEFLYYNSLTRHHQFCEAL